MSDTILDIAEWLRGDEAEQIARTAEREGIAPEDALAAAIELRYYSAGPYGNIPAEPARHAHTARRSTGRPQPEAPLKGDA